MFGRRDGWRGEQAALDEAERIKETREKYRRENLARPEAVQVIALNHRERDAARDVYQTMEAVMKVNYQKRTGEDFPLEGLNSAQVVDEIVHAINLSRVRQAGENMTLLRDGRSAFTGD